MASEDLYCTLLNSENNLFGYKVAMET